MRVLHAIHDFLPRHRAGSEIYCLELCKALQARGIGVHVLCAEYDPARAQGDLVWRAVDGIGVTEVINNWAFSGFAESYDSPALAARLDQVLEAIQPDVLHVHNLHNLAFSLPALARRRGIPVVATLHDYTLVCAAGGQRVHLAEEHVCHRIDTARCARCFPQHPLGSQLLFGQRALRHTGGRRLGALATAIRRRFPGVASRLARAAVQTAPPPLTAAAVEARLEAARQVFSTVDLFVAPSPALGAEYRRLGMPEERLRISDYGFPPLRGTAPTADDPGPAARAPRPLRVGFMGTLVWHKGVHVLIAAAARLPPGLVELVIFGDPTVFPDYTARLQRESAGLAVRFAGAFGAGGAAGALAQMDVLVVPSLWPENSPLVIHEAFQAGVPVAGSRLGGTADLVVDGECGLLYDAYSPDALAAALRRLAEEPALLPRLRKGIPPVKSIADDAAEWEGVYRALLAGEAPPARAGEASGRQAS